MNRHFRAAVSDNTPINPNHMLITLRPSEGTEPSRPGQFYMIGFEGLTDPLLKRPFSIFSHTGGELKFLYRKVGKGTELLAGLRPGNEVTLLGPLGNHYPRPRRNQTPVVVAGGVGIASLFPFIEHTKSIVLYGGRTEGELLLLDDITRHAAELILATDDGTRGLRGTVVDALKQRLDKSDIENPVIYACGPTAMLKAVAIAASSRGVKGYLSLEERMACGFGVCQGCVTQTKKGFERVCKEGPVFEAGHIVWQS